MESRKPSPWMCALVAVLFLYLLAPVLLVFPLSFSGDATLTFPPSRWGVRWYTALLADPKIVGAFLVSLGLGVAVTLASLVIALPTAFVIVRLRPRGAQAAYNVFTAPLLLPTIVLGLAILIVFARMNLLAASFLGLLLAHLVVTLPYALRVLVTALGNLPQSVEEAAATLGASPFTVFWRVTLPLLRPGIVAASALCFLVSFDEVVITLFLTGPRITTLPVELFHRVEMNADPLVASVSALLIVLTLTVVIIVDRSAGLSRTFVK